MKNVIAIAAGVVEGLGLGHNALAALITRGLAEITRLACAAGGRRETTAGLSGLGDLVLTCTGRLSRNRHVGLELARGRRLHEILAGMKMIAEGVNTTRAVLALGERYGVELPIATQMAAVLDGRSEVRAAVDALMVRPQRTESEGRSEHASRPQAAALDLSAIRSRKWVSSAGSAIVFPAPSSRSSIASKTSSGRPTSRSGVRGRLTSRPSTPSRKC